MIQRLPELASERLLDVAIVGGGILGVCHALEAVRRRLSVLLLESDDYGGGVSASSQRIVHGGLRYVQSLDFTRHRESFQERRWFLTHFPEFVCPLSCLMPLYNIGLKRMSTMRAAFWLNDALSRSRNNGVGASWHIPAGQILSSPETLRDFPAAATRGLRGGARWHDAMLHPPQRVLIEILRWAVSGGATAVNYTRVDRIRRESSSTYAIEAFDRIERCTRRFRATHVINCAGSWAAGLHRRDAIDDGNGGPPPPLSLAFSLLLDRPPVSCSAVAVSPRQSGDPIYFVVPIQNKILAGTVHLPWRGPALAAEPGSGDIERFLVDLNTSIPGLEVARSDVLRIFSGLLPARNAGSARTASRPIRRIHLSSTPQSQLIAIWGVKYTTARSVADETLRLLAPWKSPETVVQPRPMQGLNWSRWIPPTAEQRADFETLLRRIRSEESVMCVEDLLHRRTDWGLTRESADAASTMISDTLDLPFASEIMNSVRSEATR